VVPLNAGWVTHPCGKLHECGSPHGTGTFSAEWRWSRSWGQVLRRARRALRPAHRHSVAQSPPLPPQATCWYLFRRRRLKRASIPGIGRSMGPQPRCSVHSVGKTPPQSRKQSGTSQQHVAIWGSLWARSAPGFDPKASSGCPRSPGECHTSEANKRI